MRNFIDELEINNPDLIDLKDKISQISQVLYNHPIYESINTIEKVKIYMEHQVWCVWDFMTLLKGLQFGLLKNNIEWCPLEDGNIGAFIYEILLTEETDITPDSKDEHSSHFEIYVNAMKQANADTGPIIKFITNLKNGKDFQSSVENVNIPQAALEFTNNTLKHAKSPLHIVVSVFCLSREGIIPGMFVNFLKHFSIGNNLTIFRWYLNRHIEVDSDSHGPLSIKLFNKVMNNDLQKLKEALEASIDALTARKTFLDAILLELSKTN
jgi:hypothetical protein